MENNEICPMCQQQNRCTVNTNPVNCWCMTVEISAQQRQLLPEMTECLCAACLQKIIAVHENI